jgi:DNA primase
VFRICNEVTFCFDGDRAGRAAAWKALENSLSQVREGRQMRFLFLPEGHDPDTLVGEEGREAFEARIKQAMPLSEYFINHLSAQVDTHSIDGRAQLGALARPLLERIPAGIFRELLADEVAKTVGLKSGRLTSMLSEGAEKTAAPEPARRLMRPQVQTGRRNLVRQAIHLLVHYPEIADKVVLNPVLTTLERPGIPLLIDLIEELARRPCANTGALLERWRDRPDVEHLAKLAAQECLVDAAGAASDLAGAVQQLAADAMEARQRLLLSRATQLTDAEKAELQGLLARKPPVVHGA